MWIDDEKIEKLREAMDRYNTAPARHCSSNDEVQLLLDLKDQIEALLAAPPAGEVAELARFEADNIEKFLSADAPSIKEIHHEDSWRGLLALCRALAKERGAR